MNANIIIVKLFLSTQHPSSYEMVRPSPALRLTTHYKWMMCASRISRDAAQLSRPLLSTKKWRNCLIITGASSRVTAHVSTLFTGHKQRFIHSHVTRSPPIGIEKLSEVFMNRSLYICMYKQNVYCIANISLSFRYGVKPWGPLNMRNVRKY